MRCKCGEIMKKIIIDAVENISAEEASIIISETIEKLEGRRMLDIYHPAWVRGD